MQRNVTRREITLICPNCFTKSFATITISRTKNGEKFTMKIDSKAVEWERDASLSAFRPACHCRMCAEKYWTQGDSKDLDNFEFGKMIYSDMLLSSATATLSRLGITVLSANEGHYEDNREDPEWFEYVDPGCIVLRSDNGQKLKLFATICTSVSNAMPGLHDIRCDAELNDYTTDVLRRIGISAKRLSAYDMIELLPSATMLRIYVDDAVLSQYADFPHTKYMRKCGEIKSLFIRYINEVVIQFAEAIKAQETDQ